MNNFYYSYRSLLLPYHVIPRTYYLILANCICDINITIKVGLIIIIARNCALSLIISLLLILIKQCLFLHEGRYIATLQVSIGFPHAMSSSTVMMISCISTLTAANHTLAIVIEIL